MKNVIFIVLLFIGLSGFSQNNNPDSLHGQWYCVESDENITFTEDRMISDGLHLGYSRLYYWVNDSIIHIGEDEFYYEKLDDLFITLSLVDSLEHQMHLKKLN